MTTNRETFHPTGIQYHLKKGETSAIISSVGATLRSFRFQNESYVEETPIDEMASKARGQMLIPWANRVADGRYVYQGVSYQLPINEIALNNSIHGLVRWQEFDLISHSVDTLALRYLLVPSPGWPFILETTINFELKDALLLISINFKNRGTTSAPLVFGSHPYLKIPNRPVQECSLYVPANQLWLVDEKKNPVEKVSVDDSASLKALVGPSADTVDLDFRSPRRIGGTYLDYAFTDLINSSGQARQSTPDHAMLDSFDRAYITDGTRKCGIFYDQNFDHVQAYFDSSNPSNASIALEPMTGPPNAFNLEPDSHVLEPFETKDLQWGIFIE